MYLYHLKEVRTFLKNYSRLSRLILPQLFLFLFYSQSVLWQRQKASIDLIEFDVLLKCMFFFIRSIQLRLWKAIQLSQMGFLVILQLQEHHSLCNQAYPKVGGSEYILICILLGSIIRIT